MSVAWELGHAYALSGDVARSVSTLQESVRQADADHCRTGHAIRLAWLAEAEYRSGHAARGVELGEQALRLAREHHEPGAEAEALLILGDFAAAAGDRARRLEYQRRALSIAATHGLRPLQARCHLALARAQDASSVDTARSLAMASELATSMGMVVPTLDPAI
jgi:tetratricopeptide (TPR) repeat protein